MNGEELIRGVNILSEEKGISKEEIFEYIEAALNAAYKRNYNASNSKVTIDRKTGEVKVFSYKVIVDEINMEDEEDAQVLLEEVKDKDLKVGDVIEEEVTPKDFGRVAASTAKQVLVQKVREAERNSIMEEFADKEGELLIGTLSREDKQNYYVDFGRASGILPKNDIIPGEKLEMGSQIKVYVTKIEEGQKGGPVIILSRTHYGFVKRLLESEIPELAEGDNLSLAIGKNGQNVKLAARLTKCKIDVKTLVQVQEEGINIYKYYEA